jgi:hypothetical protein
LASYIARRKFLATLLGGAVAAWPLAARAPQSGKLPTIGFLGTAAPSTTSPWITAFVQRMLRSGRQGLYAGVVKGSWSKGALRFGGACAIHSRLRAPIRARRPSRAALLRHYCSRWMSMSLTESSSTEKSTATMVASLPVTTAA